jgi:isocitrate/isopropylmalate dehydrogenase
MVPQELLSVNCQGFTIYNLDLTPSFRKMVPQLPPSKLKMTRDMILGESLNKPQIVKAAECDKLSIINLRNNLHRFGNVRAPLTRVRRRRSVTPSMLEAVCVHLHKKPGMYLDE